jgi:hypothetical protein
MGKYLDAARVRKTEIDAQLDEAIAVADSLASQVGSKIKKADKDKLDIIKAKRKKGA